MAEQRNQPDERWQQVIQQLNPEQNMRAMSDMLLKAASASEDLLSSVAQGTNDTSTNESATGDSNPWRDVLSESNRLFDGWRRAMEKLAADSSFRPGPGGPGHAGSGAEVVVVDGVGTTSIEIAGAVNVPHCSDLRRHDGHTIGHEALRILQSTPFDGNPSFVVRVDVPDDTPSGTYHGQLLVEDLPDLALSLTIKVLDSDVG